MFLDRWAPARRGVAALVLVTFTSFMARDLVFVSAAHAATPREELTKAEDYFQVADFQTALEKVDVLLKSGNLEGTLLRDAHILKARSQLGLAHRSAAVDAFCSALKVDPAWRPDPDFYTNDEVQVFEQARASCSTVKTTEPTEKPATTTTQKAAATQVEESKPWYKKPLYLGLIGAALVGGVVLAAGGGDDEDPDLAGFPPPP
ncbi:MAG TPA: hypothetical protein VFR10_11150 [bacterium]|nr:hypothetical protein [bacterium]